MSEKKIKRKVIRIAMLGDSTVGKTSIVNTFLNIEFTEEKVQTVGNERMETKMKMKDGNNLKIIIWDTAGQERFHSISTNSIKTSQGVCLCFDLTSKKTFQNAEVWLKDIRENNNTIPIALFGNKIDLINDRVVSEEEAKEFANKNGLDYFETSAKSNINIKEGFAKLAELAYEKVGGAQGMELKKNSNKKQNSKKNC